MQYKITGYTSFGGLIGKPASHSLSPAMHNYSFQKLGIDHVYLAFEVGEDRLKETLDVFRNLNVFGFNITMPCKRKIMEYLDDIDDAARLIGAVNTVVKQGDRLVGYNTDGIGYVESVRRAGIDIRGLEVTILGAGGAACAAAAQMALDGAAKIHVANRRTRSWASAERLVDTINANTGCKADLTDLNDAERLSEVISSSALLTNATSVGMAPKEEISPITDLSVFREGLTVSDVIYHPERTKLLKEAAAHGCRTFGGLYMLLYQGAAAFHLWTGQDMPVEDVKREFFS